MKNQKKIQAKDLLSNPFYPLPFSQIAITLEESEDTIKNWLKDPKFMKSVFSQYHLYDDVLKLQILKVLASLCLDGNLQAIKLYLDLQEKERKEGQQVVTIVDDIPN